MTKKFKGPSYYTEEDSSIFKGRVRETSQLFYLVANNKYSICYAESGEGKSSLINAGLLPLLRKNQYLPILIRFEEGDFDTYNIDAILKKKVTSIIDKYKSTENYESLNILNINFNNEEESLLDWLNNKELRISSYTTLTPVLIFDQFEEIFTLPNDINWTASFFLWLNKLYVYDLNNSSNFGNFKVLFSLRSEFVCELDYWAMTRFYMPEYKNNRYYLKPLNKKSAYEIVSQLDTLPGKYSIDDIISCAKVERIKDFKDIDSEMPAVSALVLSMILTELQDNRDIIESASQLSPENNDVHAFKFNILSNVYEKALLKAGIGLDSGARDSIENALLDSNNKRRRIDINTDKDLLALDGKNKIIKSLSESRIIKITKESENRVLIELAHDSIKEVVASHKSKKLSLLQQETEKLKEIIEKRKTGQLNILYYFICVLHSLLWLFLSFNFIFTPVISYLYGWNSDGPINFICNICCVLFALVVPLYIVSSIFNSRRGSNAVFLLFAICFFPITYESYKNGISWIFQNNIAEYHVYACFTILLSFILNSFYKRVAKYINGRSLGYKPIYITFFLLLCISEILTIHFPHKIYLATNLYDSALFVILIPCCFIFVAFNNNAETRKRWLYPLLSSVISTPIFFSYAGIFDVININVILLLSIIAQIALASAFAIKRKTYFISVFYILLCVVCYLHNLGYWPHKINSHVDRTDKMCVSWNFITIDNGSKKGYITYDGEEILPCIFDKLIIGTNSNNCNAYAYYTEKKYYINDNENSLAARSLYPISYNNGELKAYIIPAWEKEMQKKTNLTDSLKYEVFRSARIDFLNAVHFKKKDGVSTDIIDALNLLYQIECGCVVKYIKEVKNKGKVMSDSVVNNIRKDITNCVITLHLIEALSRKDFTNDTTIIRTVIALQDFAMYKMQNSKIAQHLHITCTTNVNYSINEKQLYKGIDFSSLFDCKKIYENDKEAWYTIMKFQCIMDNLFYVNNLTTNLQKTFSNLNDYLDKQQTNIVQLNNIKDSIYINIANEFVNSSNSSQSFSDRLHEAVARNKSKTSRKMASLLDDIIENSSSNMFLFENNMLFKRIESMIPLLTDLINPSYPDYNSGYVDLCQSLIIVSFMRGYDFTKLLENLKHKYDECNNEIMVTATQIKEYKQKSDSILYNYTNQIKDYKVKFDQFAY